MKVLVTGVKDSLGYDVVRNCKKRGHEAVGVDIDEMDITDAAAVERVMTEVQPDAVIHWVPIPPSTAQKKTSKSVAESMWTAQRILLKYVKTGLQNALSGTDYIFLRRRRSETIS